MWFKKKNLDLRLVELKFSFSFTNSLQYSDIFFHSDINIYSTFSFTASNLFWSRMDSVVTYTTEIVNTIGASAMELTTNEGVTIPFGGTNVYTQFFHPIRTRWVRVKTSLGAGSAGTVSFFVTV